MTESRIRGAYPVLTVGHSTRTFEDFVELLVSNGVELLVDVRRFPHSSLPPQFEEDSLPGHLREGDVG